jgi:5-bromo-4-chloroindolyl phosphate hydrolysis protein
MTDPVTEFQSDHDLLVRLDERYASMHKDIKELKEGNEKRLSSAESAIDKLQNDHVSKDDLQKVGDQIESLKLWRSMLIGAWSVCTLVLIPLAFAYFT